jgi:ACS family glucarate transporter-like MFS transporter
MNIGYLVQASGSLDTAMVFVGLNALVAMVAYLFVVGDIRRVELRGLRLVRKAGTGPAATSGGNIRCRPRSKP